jgi:hypothetical protein
VKQEGKMICQTKPKTAQAFSSVLRTQDRTRQLLEKKILEKL